MSPHDHGRCVRRALAAAERTCRTRGLRLTPLRRRVLELVWQSHRPAGAYELLRDLNRAGGRTAPATVYRALDFLLGAGLLHRVNSLNAFVGCAVPSHEHMAQLLICSDCHTVVEIDSDNVHRALRQGAAARGFRLQSEAVELTGVCPACRK